jgi:hypothetical protein
VAGKSKIDAEDIQAAVNSEGRLATLKKLEEIEKQVSGFEKKRRKSTFNFF